MFPPILKSKVRTRLCELFCSAMLCCKEIGSKEADLTRRDNTAFVGIERGYAHSTNTTEASKDK